MKGTILAIAAAAGLVSGGAEWQRRQVDAMKRDADEVRIKQDRLEHQIEVSNALVAAVVADQLTLGEAADLMIPALGDAESFQIVFHARYPELRTLRECVAIYLLNKLEALAETDERFLRAFARAHLERRGVHSPRVY